MIPQLDQALLHPDLEQSWKDCLSEWEDGDETDKTTAHRWAQVMRDQFVAAARDIDHSKDGTTLNTAAYLMLRAQWTLLNLRIGHRAARGDWDMGLLYRAALLSQLTGIVEDRLPPHLLARIRAVFSAPVLEGTGTPQAEFIFSPGQTFLPPDLAGLVSGESAAFAASRWSALCDAATQAHVENDRLRRQWETLEREVGATTPQETLERVRDLSDRCLERERALAQTAVPPAEETTKRRPARAQNAADWQTKEAYLTREFGTSDVCALAKCVRELRNECAGLRERIGTLEVERAVLAVELGTGDLQEALTEFRAMRDRVETTYLGVAALFGDIEGELDLLNDGGEESPVHPVPVRA